MKRRCSSALARDDLQALAFEGRVGMKWTVAASRRLQKRGNA